MSVASSIADKLSPVSATTVLRLAALCLPLAAFVIAVGPPTPIARTFGWRFARGAPVLFQRFLCAGLGVRVRGHGALGRAAKQLVVADHVSWLDIPVLATLAPMSFLAKTEIGDNPTSRELVGLQGVIYVDRGRRSCIPKVNVHMIERMRGGSPVALFAEATTGDGNRLMRFRSSHFEAIRQAAAGDDHGEAIIQPIYLDYSPLAGLPIARGERPRVAWYGDITFFDHFIRGGGVTCDVYCGTPIPVGPGLDRKTAARLTEAAVRGLAVRARASHPRLFSRDRKAPTLA
jgi:lyso-ornithine lipid O-acyltransferase